MSSHSESLVTLVTAASELEAQVVVNVLREHGIEAAMTGSFTAQFRAEAPGVVRVLVRQQDLAVAESVLTELGPSRGTSAADPEDTEGPEGPEWHGRPRFTQWSSWAVLAWAAFALAGPLIGWLVANSLSGRFTNAVITALLMAAACVLAVLVWHSRHSTP